MTDNSRVLVSIGQPVRLLCNWNVLSFPWTVVWQHKFGSLVHYVSRSSEKVVGKRTSRVSSNGTMVWFAISDVDFSDAGEYTCFSYLQSGKSFNTTQVLQVEGNYEALWAYIFPLM